MSRYSSILTFLLFIFLIRVSNAQSTDCSVEIPPVPQMTIGLVFPSETFLTPHRGDFYQGAVAMLQTYRDCSSSDINWVTAFAEDYDGAVQAVDELVVLYDIQLVIGGGSTAISNGLNDAVDNHNIVLWETTDGLQSGGINAFSATSSNYQRGHNVAQFVQERYGEDARIALIYNKRQRSAGIAEGIRSIMVNNIVIENQHEEDINASDLARQIRRQTVDVVILVTFQTVADDLWRAMRDEDANVKGWLNVGDPGYRNRLCSRIGDSEGLITIHRFAMTNPIDTLFDDFAQTYRDQYETHPSERAHFTASGVYMLLTHVLSRLDTYPSTDDIRNAMYATDVMEGEGLMGEGLRLSDISGSNERASLVIQQNQNGQFCTAFPAVLATCPAVEDFLSWRDRAVLQDTQGCTEPWPDPDL